MPDERWRLAAALRDHLEGLRAFGVTALPIDTRDLRPETSDMRRETHDNESLRSPVSGLRSQKEERLAKLRGEVERCRRCSLYRTRTHAVVSDGTANARLVFVGEAPGREEDLQGKPFVGAAGQLLTKMIEAIGMKRQDVYICNVLKDRPPGNRAPLPEEMDACLPFLREQLAVVQPRVICTLGAVASQALLGPHIAITKVRGTVFDYEGIPLIPTFHPAYLLRNPPAKKFAWADLKHVKRLLQTSDMRPET